MKKIKIVDEHDIERIGNVVCSVDVGGSDYIFYFVERDSENDNVFVSKLIDNKTKMINLDDESEKDKISNIIKNMIMDAVNSEKDKVDSASIKIDNVECILGDINIDENNVQEFNISKTYITTVKKTVTKVYCDFYDIEFSKKNVDNIFEDIPAFEPLPSKNIETSTISNVTPESIAPIIDIPNDIIKEESENNEDKILTDIPVINAPVLDATGEFSKESEIKIETPVVESVSVVGESVPNLLEPEKKEETSVVSPAIESAPVVGESVPNLLEPEKKEETPVVSPAIESAPVVGESVPNLLEPEKKEETSVVSPVIESAPVVGDKLVFDASKESNLNAALGEVSNETKISVNEIDSVREFGMDKPTAIQKPDMSPENSNSSSGHASNKFVMIVAILFFVASCIFLGYEVFNYIQTK